MKKAVTAFFDFWIRLLGKEVFFYLVFGGLTTFINIVSYAVCDELGASTPLAITVAFVLSVLFAYVTNRKYVFESRAAGLKPILLEMWKFFSVRIATYFVDLGLMILLVDILTFHKLLSKIAANIVVVILNYVASKVFVFRKK